MQQVYVVMSGLWYEGSDVVGVFLTQEEAIQFCKLEQEQGMCDYIDIIIWQGTQKIGRIPYYVREEEEEE